MSELCKPPLYPNPLQPRRPHLDDNGNRLWFRTYISGPYARYDLFDILNVICQTKLYRWCKAGFINRVPIADLHQHLFFDQEAISKKRLGTTIRQAVAYDPTKLVGRRRDNPKACSVYQFHNPKELEYGLEWLICPWLRRVVLAETVDEVEDGLKELVEVKDEELSGLFWRPFMESHIQETISQFDWPKVWKQYGLTKQQAPGIVKPRAALRGLK